MIIPGVPSSMLACQVVEFGKPYKIHHVPMPAQLDPHDILVRIGAASFCHTDIMVQEGNMEGTKLPCTASHEGAGTVVAVGEAVSEFKVGDRVLCGITYHRCGSCASCKGPESQTHYCPNASWLGVLRDGAFAEFEVVDGRQAVLLPDEIDFATAAPFACAGATVWGGVIQADLQSGQWIALVGSGGGLGHLGLQFAKAKGLKVIGIDARDAGLTMTKNFGADIALDARDGEDAVKKAVLDATDGQGVDATLNISDAPGTAALAIAVTKMNGTVVQIGLADLDIPHADFVLRGIKLLGSMLCSRGQMQDMIRFVAENGITVQKNVFHGLSKIPDLIDLVKSGKMLGKAIVVLDEA